MIVKDDQENLENALKKLVEFNFEIIVVDTGSTDQSKEVAKKYTDKVYDFVWCNDFAKARNFAISKASNDYVMMFDSDEVVIKLNRKQVIRMIRENPTMIGYIRVADKGMGDRKDDAVWSTSERLFNRKLYRYEGSIHEQIVAIHPGTKETRMICPISVEHHGYSGEEKVRGKGKRNLELLLKIEEQGNATGYDYFQIGQSYRMLGEDEKSIQYYEKALDLITDTSLEYVETCVISYGNVLIKQKKAQRALTLYALYEDYKDSADYLFMLGMVYAANRMFERAIGMFEQATKAPKCNTEGTNSYLAQFNAGRIYELMGNKEQAIAHYERCESMQAAKDGLKRLHN